MNRLLGILSLRLKLSFTFLVTRQTRAAKKLELGWEVVPYSFSIDWYSDSCDKESRISKAVKARRSHDNRN